MKTFTSKALAGLGILILVALFARTLPSARSETQREFDQWLEAREQVYVAAAQRTPAPGGEQVNLPMVSLEAVPAEGNSPARFSLGQGADPEHMLRLLMLMRDANIFTIGDKSEQEEGPGSYTVRVQEGEEVFQSRFGQSDIESNVQARTMLKLFEQFAVPLNTLETQGDKV